MTDSRPPLLFLCHRIPFPPNKGDKIRSYHWLKMLSRDYRIYLAAFIDDPDDERHSAAVRDLCEEACLVRLNPLLARARSLVALASRAPLTLPYFNHRRLRTWISQIVERVKIERCLVFSSPMAQYLLDLPVPPDTVIDYVDVDSDKWTQYAATKPAYQAWIYRREAKALAQFERQVGRSAHACVLVSEAEAKLFRDHMGPSAKVIAVPNGVDAGYFHPDPSLENPFEAGMRTIVFTGAMDYWPNVDAALWFVEEVLPEVRRTLPHVTFHIVGSNPASALRRLAVNGVMVTGRVADVRPYLQHAGAVVAPMRIARGIQNKVLEGMSMARCVVTTSRGLEGIDASPGQDLLLADDAIALAQAVCRVLETPDLEKRVGAAARRFVESQHSWEHGADALRDLLERAISSTPASEASREDVG